MFRRTIAYNILLAAIALVAIVWFYPHPKANHYKFEEGRPWNYAKLIAPFDIPIRPDSASVLRVRDSLDRKFVPVFHHAPATADSVITSLMAQWVRLSDNSNVSEADNRLRKKVVAYLKSAYLSDVIEDEFAARIADGSLTEIRLNDDNKVTKRSASGIISVSGLMDRMLAALADSGAEEWMKRYEVGSLLKPNLVYDAATSKQLYDYDLYRFTAIRGVIQQGQTIIDKGAVITPQDYTNLLTYEEMVDKQLTDGQQSNVLIWLGQFLYVSLLLAALMLYLRFHTPDIWNFHRSMLFIVLSVTVFFLIAIGMDHFIDGGIYVVPYMVVPILLMVFFSAQVAVVVTMTLTLLCGGVASFPLEFIILQTMASAAAVFSLKELSQRTQLLRTSIFVFVVYVAAYTAIELMMNGSLADFSWRMVVFLTVSALLASMAYVLMAVIEKPFGFISMVTLVELTDINNPLLRELSENCPGTFQHSMAVSNLAADAAMRIGANVQLVRAGALYHDIGKMENPNFFTENQHGVNPHDALPPERSAEIIIRHVADGLRRAEKAGLPAVLRRFISEHHGAGKAKYFYYAWVRLHPDETPDDRLFSYPGPNPRSRETSVMMMADSVEAASRSLSEHTPEAISELVNRLIDTQIAEGLHNDSPLSFRDVRIIKEAFIKRLMTMYHSRISYPQAPKA